MTTEGPQHSAARVFSSGHLVPLTALTRMTSFKMVAHGPRWRLRANAWASAVLTGLENVLPWSADGEVDRLLRAERQYYLPLVRRELAVGHRRI